MINGTTGDEVSLVIYIIKDTEYILKRSNYNKTEYYYCIISSIIDEKSVTIRGNLNLGILTFERIDFHYEIKESDLINLNRRVIC
jgi:hypothetical protein